MLRRERGRAVTSLTVAYPVPPEAGGARGGDRDVSVIAVCASERGDRSEPVRFEGPVRVVEDVRGRRIVLYFDLRIPPARYTWSVAVTDQSTRITSFLHFASVLED